MPMKWKVQNVLPFVILFVTSSLYSVHYYIITEHSDVKALTPFSS